MLPSMYSSVWSYFIIGVFVWSTSCAEKAFPLWSEVTLGLRSQVNDIIVIVQSLSALSTS